MDSCCLKCIVKPAQNINTETTNKGLNAWIELLRLHKVWVDNDNGAWAETGIKMFSLGTQKWGYQERVTYDEPSL